MTLTDPDRTHWDRCWRIHQACAVARVEQLEARMAQMESEALEAMAGWRARVEHLERLLDDQVAHARPTGWTDPAPRTLTCACRCVALDGQVAALQEVVNDLRGQLAMARATVTGHGRLT